ncbi:amino acid adenylation domain-containing protein [Lentzea sp. BCCO 10_0856]|uniref:Amino acid adenylation domain-containing protein n=1 Tax=Lentzea miocenica TaxID=3095431 RepID=A0ABU4T082_9PSEU|nr:amino acid adenylation domain-containing protein [Lentzea sp. BCCO 10_0856]MDX8031373.1 amino acid adenylation domain-containing protein [Lentzea sp. BCCO 10_0856]
MTLWLPVSNERGDRSIWRADRRPPEGWCALGPATDREQALAVAAEAGPRTPGPHGGSPTVDGVCAEVASRHPDRVAVLDGDREITYEELFTRAAGVRAGLVRLGVRRGDAVGVCLDRGTEMIAVLLGTLMAGAAYVPLDGRSPAARLEFVASDAELVCVVASESCLEACTAGGVPVVRPEELDDEPLRQPSASEPDDVAYVMFTSGSTGRPKGVEVTHRNVVAFLDATAALLPPSAPQRVLFGTRLTFDIAGLEIYLPLSWGGTCVVAQDTWLLRPRSLARLINAVQPTLVQATPVQWRLLLDAGATFSAEQTLLCGGDVLPPGLAAQLAGLTAWNVYGPTEATVWATAWRATPGAVRIGSAMDHATVYVLDEHGDRATEGELFIGGPAVAAGYRGRPRLTAERFVPDPFSPVAGARMYATGDLVRAHGDELEFLCRNDNQVKLNGVRLELGEIESLAAGVPGVRAAVAVVVANDGVKTLQLFLDAPAPSSCDAARSALEQHLSSSVMPSRIVAIDSFPTTANGKIDRKALASLAERR